MLQYPINFYPDGHTFDPTFTNGVNKSQVSFNFKGDVLLSVHFKIYDYDTETLIFSGLEKGASYNSKPMAYNNADISLPNIFINHPEIFTIDTEHKYVVQLLLTGGVGTNNLLHDRFVLRGEIVNDYDHTTDTTNMVLEDRINLIYEWNIDANNVRTPVYIENDLAGTIIMKIGNEERTVTSYNYNTGEITLDSAFEGDYPKGEPYQLYSNYLVTQQYFFKTIPYPALSNLQAKWADIAHTTMYGVNFTADYTLNEYNPLKYYTITMEKQDGEDIVNEPRHYVKIYETEKIYSQKIEYTFIDDYDVYNAQAGLPIGNSQTRRYLFTINGVLQNGMKISAQLESVAGERADEPYITHLSVEQGSTTGLYYNVVKVKWIHSTEDMFATVGGARIYRYDMTADNVIASRVLLASIEATNDIYIDTTVSTHGSYKYVVVPFLRQGNNIYETGTEFTPLISDLINTDMYGYTITEIKYYGGQTRNGKAQYRIGESWHLIADVEDTTITQNTDKVLHVGYGKYSSATHTGLNYMSGTFNGALVQPVCEGDINWKDDIELVKAWRDFITRDCLYVLRSQKGDVWVVNIVDNPTTNYVEKYKPIPTNVSFSWAECADINDLMILNSNVW